MNQCKFDVREMVKDERDVFVKTKNPKKLYSGGNLMHEGAVCREIMDIVSEAAIENEIQKIYEIVISVGPYSCHHEGQLNFYFDVMKKETIMEEGVIRLEQDDTLTGTSQMYVKTFRGE